MTLLGLVKPPTYPGNACSGHYPLFPLAFPNGVEDYQGQQGACGKVVCLSHANNYDGI
jgi:hypothetical protein